MNCVGIRAALSHSPRTLSDRVSVRISTRHEAMLKNGTIARRKVTLKQQPLRVSQPSMTLSQYLRRRLLRFISLFLTILALVGLTATLHVSAQPDNYTQIARSQTTTVVRATAAIPVVSVDRLPPEARSTINLIRQGGPFPYPKDGTVFRNRERQLPQAGASYYREYTVKTPGIRSRGARRLITGQGGEIYYTGDHYASFVRVQ